MWGKKGGRSTQTMNIIGALAYTLCLYSLYFIRYIAFFIKLFRRLLFTFVDNFVLRMFDLFWGGGGVVVQK